MKISRPVFFLFWLLVSQIAMAAAPCLDLVSGWANAQDLLRVPAAAAPTDGIS